MSDLPTAISHILSESRVVAVVGLSPNPERPSHEVACYLQQHGYRVIPINPMCTGQHILGEHCYATLTQARSNLTLMGIAIDIVDCFRRSEEIVPIADEAIAIGARCLWMQQGVINEVAAAKASAAGLTVVMDRCIKIDHMGLQP
jgi:predicted CoA-binding protein